MELKKVHMFPLHRLNREDGDGAWCPEGQLERSDSQYLQVRLSLNTISFTTLADICMVLKYHSSLKNNFLRSKVYCAQLNLHQDFTSELL